MPLRKQGTIIPAGAVALLLAAAAVPSSASAWSFGSWGSSTTSAVTSAATTTTTAVTTTTSATTSTVTDTADALATTTTGAVTTTTDTVDATTDAVVATVAPKTTGCQPLPTRQAFAKYNDTADYYLAPGGSFESGTAAWRLTSGAKIVSGNENLGVQSGAKALDLPVGATATSPEFCVDETNPSFRFASKLSSLDGGYVAIVLYRDAAGKLTQAQFTSSGAGSFYNGATGWNPSAVSPLATKIPLVAGGETATVQLMFVGTTKAYGGWVGAKATIDSVMVDPYRRG